MTVDRNSSVVNQNVTRASHYIAADRPLPPRVRRLRSPPRHSSVGNRAGGVAAAERRARPPGPRGPGPSPALHPRDPKPAGPSRFSIAIRRPLIRLCVSVAGNTMAGGPRGI